MTKNHLRPFYYIQSKPWKKSIMDIAFKMDRESFANQTFYFDSLRLLLASKESSFKFLPLQMSHFQHMAAFLSNDEYVYLRSFYLHFKVVPGGYHRYFFGVKVKAVKLIGGTRFLAARSGLNGRYVMV